MAESKKQLTVVLASQGADKLVVQFKAMQDAAKMLGASIDTSMQSLNAKSGTARQQFKLTVDSAVSLRTAIEQINAAMKQYPGLTWFGDDKKFKSALQSAKEGQAKTGRSASDVEFNKWYAEELKKETALAKQAAKDEANARKEARRSYIDWWKTTLNEEEQAAANKAKQDKESLKLWQQLLKQKEQEELASIRRVNDARQIAFSQSLAGRNTALAQNVKLAATGQAYGTDSIQYARAQAAAQEQAIRAQLASRVQKAQTAFQAGTIGQAGLGAILSNAFAKAEADIKRVNSVLIEHKKRLDEAAKAAGNVGEAHKSFAVRVVESIGLYRIFNTTLNLTEQALLSIPKAGIALEGTTATLTAVFNSAAGAANELAFLTEEAKRTGLPLEQLRKSYANVAASFMMAGESADTTRQIFQDMNTVATTLHLSADRVDAVFLALSQMFNKGRVQAEELTKQLSQTLPGITNQTAKALGLSAAELSDQMQKGLITAHDAVKKMMAQMAEEFGGAAFRKASQGLNAELGRIKTNWTLLAEGVYSLTSGIITDTVRMANGVMEAIQPLIKTFQWFRENSDTYRKETIAGLGERANATAGKTKAVYMDPLANPAVREAFIARKIAQQEYEKALEDGADIAYPKKVLEQATKEYQTALKDSQTKIGETYKKGAVDLSDEIAQVSMLTSQAEEDAAATAEKKFLIRNKKLIDTLIKASSEGSVEAGKAYADLMKVYSTVGAKAVEKAGKGGAAERLRAGYSDIKTMSQEVVASVEADLNRLDVAYADNVISIADYFAKRTALEQKANSQRLAGIESEIKLAEASKDLDKAASLRLEKVNLEIKIENDKTKTLKDQITAYKDLKSSMADISSEYEKIHGRSGTVYQLSDKFQADRKRLLEQAGSATSTSAQREEAVTSLAQLQSIEQYYSALNKASGAVDDYANAKENLAIIEERIQNDLKMGAISELDALKQTGQARQDALANMERYVQLQSEAFKGLPEDSPAVRGLARMRNEVAALRAEADPFFSKFKNIFEQGFADSFTAFANGTQTAKQAFQSFALSVVQGIQQIIAKELASKIFSTFIGPALGGLFGGLSSNPLSAFSASKVSAQSVALQPMSSVATRKLASGGIMSGSGISAYSGSVVNRPTVFPFAKGIGLMGEAGAEAILPLKRNPQGKLGVVASGSQGLVQNSGNEYNVTVHVTSGKNDTPAELGSKIGESVIRMIAKEEIANARRSGNMLNKSRFA